ncbi:MAG: hypothetical protein ABI333_12845 [bacterium]
MFRVAVLGFTVALCFGARAGAGAAPQQPDESPPSQQKQIQRSARLQPPPQPQPQLQLQLQLQAPATRLTLTQGQQRVAFLSGGVIKPLYMLLTLLLLLFFWRSRATDLRLLWHGLLWFLVGETFCAVNYYFHSPGIVYPVDLLHGVGMVAMSALIPWGLYRLFDDRVMHFADPEQKCQAQRLCGRCWKRDDVACNPHRLMYFLVVALAAVSLMPLSKDLPDALIVTKVFGSDVDYGAPLVNHLVELRLYPILGAVGFGMTLLLLLGGPKSVRRAEPVFFVSLGLLSYSMLRFLLISTFGDTLWWSDFWEETTELCMVIALGMLLVLFRERLEIRAPKKRPAES